MKITSRSIFLSALVFVLLAKAGGSVHAAPAAPTGAHPRLFLTPPLLEALKANAQRPESMAALMVQVCKDVAGKPNDFTGSGYMGLNWARAGSACALAFKLTGDPAYASSGVKMWRALLEDVDQIGDKRACVPGAAAATAIASVRRDTGYAIRFIGPHTALIYDWLHDAPGVDEALRKQSRDCFAAWVTWYTSAGYLNDQPGANYHAGYVVAKTFIAVAEAGEDGANSDSIWTQAVDEILGKQIIGNGLATDNAGVPRGNNHGALVGGDWPEGWQYGPLSVVEYVLAGRAVEEQGVPLTPLHGWASDLALRYMYGLTPARDGMYVGGDCDVDGAYQRAVATPLVATLLGPSSEEAAGWAAHLLPSLTRSKDEMTVYEALAEARVVTPVDFLAGTRPPWYLARGTRNVYARSSWRTDAFWSVFTSAPRQVDDHQHPDASNFVFSRGADHLIVDPSPYGSRSSLTGNALTVESAVVTGNYAPSQTGWSEADLPWVRGTQSGVVAARGDFAKAFKFTDTPSDVPFARRDFVFLPEGEVVVLDRVRTGDASRHTHLRFRTPAVLSASAGSPVVVQGPVGASAVAIHPVVLSPSVAPLMKPIAGGGDCDSGPFGACTVSRMNIHEYSLKLPGPSVLAIHVIDALAKDEAPADVAAISAAPIDVSPPENGGVVGASVWRASKQTFVVASSAPDGAAGAMLRYSVPGANPSRHVVYDAPEDDMGRSVVVAMAGAGRCSITITRDGAAPLEGRPLIFTVGPAADGCVVSDDPNVAPGSVSPGSGSVGVPRPTMTAGGVSGGCGCAFGRPLGGGALTTMLVVVLLATGRRSAGRRR